jgi:hypothetical protein
MALVSTTGTLSVLADRIQGQVFEGQARRISYGFDRDLFMGNVRDNALGTPTPPSQRQAVVGIIKDIFWPVEAGARSISISCRYTGSGTPPRLIVKANGPVGLTADLTGSPSSSGSFVTIGPLTFTAIAAGVIHVWRERREYGTQDVNWDNLQVT